MDYPLKNEQLRIFLKKSTIIATTFKQVLEQGTRNISLCIYGSTALCWALAAFSFS
jgi:hypothetical protein